MTADVATAAARALGLPTSTHRLAVARVIGSQRRSELFLLIGESGERLIVKRYLEEHATLRLDAELFALSALSGETAIPVPRIRGEDGVGLIVVMDYVGDRTVEQVVQGDDQREAEIHLLGYASAVGTFHRAGRPALPVISKLRRDRGYADRDFWPPFARDPDGAGVGYAAYGEVDRESVAADVNSVIHATFEGSTGSATLIQWDCWPGNAVIGTNGIVLVDMESSMVAAPLVDVASWHLCFPAAPHRLPLPGRVPNDLVARMDAAYAAASGDAVDARGLAFGVASRMLFELTASGAEKLMSGTLDARIRLLYAARLEHAADLLQRVSVLPALGLAMSRVAVKARGTDLVGADVPPYPAFSK